MREDNVSFYPLQIRKPIDKATPLFAQSLGDNEKLTCEFYFYRTGMVGGNELYFKMRLLGGIITGINAVYPNSLTHNDLQPSESVSLNLTPSSGNMWPRAPVSIYSGKTPLCEVITYAFYSLYFSFPVLMSINKDALRIL